MSSPNLPHSHDWRDVRFINQTVHNFSVGTMIVTDDRDGYFMRPGQRYRCLICGDEIAINHEGGARYMSAPVAH